VQTISPSSRENGWGLAGDPMERIGVFEHTLFLMIGVYSDASMGSEPALFNRL